MKRLLALFGIIAMLGMTPTGLVFADDEEEEEEAACVLDNGSGLIRPSR